MSKQILSIRHLGRDLYADLYCTCPHKDYVGTPVAKIMKTKLTFSGYNDNYFFNEVNKEPQIKTCDCGKQYQFQWKADGVHIEYIGKLKTA